VLQQAEIMHVAMEMLVTWIYINHSGIIVLGMGDVVFLSKANKQDLALESNRICAEH
jgi:hypothetical protein